MSVSSRDVQPPRLMRWLLGRLLPRRERANLLGELADLYRHRQQREGRTRAQLWYAWHTLAFPLRLRVEALLDGLRSSAGLVESSGRDLRQGARLLLRRPGYALANIVTLAIGLGGLATVYCAANWVLLRPVPGVRAAGSLVTVQLEVKSEGSPAFPVSDPDLRTLAERSHALSGLVGSFEADVNASLAAGGEPRRLRAAAVSAGWFQLLGVRAVLGRVFAEEGPDAGAGVVISQQLWREAWAGSPGALGSTIRVNARPFVVIGVAPSGFHGAELPGEVQLWLSGEALPVIDPGLRRDVLEDRGVAIWTGLVGRLAAGASADQIPAEGAATMAAVRAAYRRHSYYADYVLRAYPGVGLSPRLRQPVRRTLSLLAGAAVFLLLLALANVTNLALVHGAARAGDAAVHAALGASRWRLGRRVLAEQLLLGLAGGAGGVLVAGVVTRGFGHASLSALGASLEGIRLDGRVVTFTMAAALSSTLLAGALPAVAGGAGRLLPALSGRRQGLRRTGRVQSALVVLQVTLSLLLVVGAGLLVRSVIRLRNADPGFEPDRALGFSLAPELQGYDAAGRRELMASVEAGLAGQPGVLAMGFVAPAPIRPYYVTIAVFPSEGTWETSHIIGAQLQVTAGFLAAAGAHLLAGRQFEPDEDRRVAAGEDPVVIISRSVARTAWPGLAPADVIGRKLSRPDGKAAPMRVVGVIDDMRLMGVAATVPPVIVLPWEGGIDSEVNGWVRVRGRPRDFASLVRGVVSGLDAALPVYRVRGVRADLDDLVIEQRVVTWLAVGLALVGLFLAGVGLHGVLGYAVTQRRREIGVRAALGAGTGRIMGRLIRDGLVLSGCGIVLGGAGALALTRVLAARLFQITPLDPLAWAAGMALLTLMTVLAVWAPVRRSLRISPREALSAE